MAVIGNTALTLADWAKTVNPDGSPVDVIIDLLSQTNEWLADMLWIESNLPTGHMTTVTTGLPQGTWRMLYQGVQPTKSTKAQVTEGIGNLEAFSEIDKMLADLNGNAQQFRLLESRAFYEGMTQQFSSALAYSNALLTPAQFMGFTPRYNTRNPAVPISANVIHGGGSGSDNTSIWFIGWGADTITGIFPKGSVAGLQNVDLGEDIKRLADGSMYRVYVEHFQWKCGLAVRDWRFAVRICNIDVSDLGGSSGANLVNLLITAANRFPVAPAGMSAVQAATYASSPVTPPRFAIYCNRTVRTALEQQIVNKPAGLGGTLMYLDPGSWDGKVILGFRGVPIRTVDSLLNNEALVTT